MGNIVRLPYHVASPELIARLVEGGYLKRAKRHDPDAIQSALEKLRLRSRPIDVFGRPEEDNDPTPAA